MNIVRLDWDSDFFGVEVGACRLVGDKGWNESLMKQWDLVYFSTDPRDIEANRLLTSVNAFMADEKTTYLMDLRGRSVPQHVSSRIVSYKSSGKDEAVINLGIQSSLFSRFSLDPRIAKRKAHELYRLWMERSISRQLANEVLVYEGEDGEPSGVITLGEKTGRSDIGILAVDENSRGQRIGKQLVDAAVNYSYQKKYDELQVVTQGSNQPACKFYESCGFKLDNVTNIYHYWKQPG